MSWQRRAILKRWADPEQHIRAKARRYSVGARKAISKAAKRRFGFNAAQRRAYMRRLSHKARAMGVWDRRVTLGGGWRLPSLPGCNREQARWFWRQARFEATLTMKKLIKAGVVHEDEVQANKALHYALSVMKAPVDQKTGLAAARIVLDFTKSKPVAKSEISISKAEEWLAAVTADNEQSPEDESIIDQDDAGNAEASA